MEAASRSGRDVAFASAVLIVALLAMVALWARTPSALGIPACPFWTLTGFYCPGCGSMRALHALLHLRVREALGLNPLAVVALPAVAYGIAADSARRLWGARWPMPALPRHFGWGVLAVVVAYWIARNLPYAAFRWMAPS